MPASSPGTVELQRVLRAPPERVYRAFVDPAAMVKWLPPHGFTGSVQHSDVRVGGGYRMAFNNFASGGSHAFDGTYLDRVPGERIRCNDQFEDPALPGTMQVEVTLAGGARRNRAADRADRDSCDDSAGGLPSRLAGVAGAARPAGRGRDSRTGMNVDA